MDYEKNADKVIANSVIGLIANTDKVEVMKFLPTFLDWLEQKEIDYRVSKKTADKLGLRSDNSIEQSEIPDVCDLILSFGGDGTFLQTARLVAPREIPIAGVNMGTFGYLAEVIVKDLQNRVEDLLAGRYTIQDRMMLNVELESEHRKIFPLIGLNDVVVDKGGHPRTIMINAYVDDEFFNTFKADGLIVSTPTGSTGYSLSAGGPIIEPETQLFIINPICPHTLANRPCVLSANKKIQISIQNDFAECSVAIDGQNSLILKQEERIIITKAKCVTKMIVFPEYSFYSLLRNKLQWKMQS